MLQLHLINIESYDFIETHILTVGETKQELAENIWYLLETKKYVYLIESLLENIEDLSIYQNNKLKLLQYLIEELNCQILSTEIGYHNQ